MSRSCSRLSTRVAAWLVLGCMTAPAAAAEQLRDRLTLQLLDGAGAPVEGAVASLHSESAAERLVLDATGDGALIEQTRGEFSPSLTVIDVGTPVRFPNLDRIRHHVYSFSPAKTFELPLYSGEPHDPVVFDTPGIVTLGCNIHDWMLAHVLVMDTPWHAISGVEGVVHLAPPPGDYLLRVWHPGLPAGQVVVEQPVTLGDAARSMELELDLSRPPLRRLRSEPPRAGEYE